MKIYLVTVSAGLLVGIIYALLGVRSPAPPGIALVGLLGILIGEQTIPIAKRALAGQPLTRAWFGEECIPNITGVRPSPAPEEPGS